MINSRNYSKVKLTSKLFKNEAHMSVVPAVISRGLRFLSPKKKSTIEKYASRKIIVKYRK